MSVPLGIDLGTVRVRIAAGERNRSGELRLRAVIARDLPEQARGEDVDAALTAAVLEDALAELDSAERRCVFALSPMHAALRYVKFPKMSWAERLRAARFEVNRWPGFDAGNNEIGVRVHPVPGEPEIYAVGATNTAVLAARTTLARLAGLRVVGIDHSSLALRRAIPDVDAIVDIGADHSIVHAFGNAGPMAIAIEPGGASVTSGIARELSLSIDVAEKRKRILGCAGAGTSEQDMLVAGIASAIERLRARVAIDRIAIVGNGGRLPEFANLLESACGAGVYLPVPVLLATSPYPADVIRSAAPDWALAAGLSSWAVAA